MARQPFSDYISTTGLWGFSGLALVPATWLQHAGLIVCVLLYLLTIYLSGPRLVIVQSCVSTVRVQCPPSLDS